MCTVFASIGSNMCVNFPGPLPTASSGTVTINADSTVQILVEEAYPLDKLDAQVHAPKCSFLLIQLNVSILNYMYMYMHYGSCVYPALCV